MAIIEDLKDDILIDFLKTNYPQISFLSETTVDKFIKQIPRDSKTLNDIFDPSKTKNLNFFDFWEQLLIDAIKYLKWHDLTEFPKDRPSDIKVAYRAINDRTLGVVSLKEFFQSFIQFERILYGAEEFYREHVYHLIKVWLTGQYIIHHQFDENFPIYIFDSDDDDFRKYMKGIEEKKLHEDKRLRMSKKCPSLFEGEEAAIWCIIALTHDLGYPLGKLEKINTSIKNMMRYFAKTKMEEFTFSFPQQNQYLIDAILQYTSSKVVKNTDASKSKELLKYEYNTHRQAKFYLKLSHSFEQLDHGIISCVVLGKNLIYFLETNFDFDTLENLKGIEEARQFVIRREILRSIASHTCHEIYHFKPNTFSFLLLFVDELQFWGRPTLRTLMSGVERKQKITLDKFSNDEISFSIYCEATDGYKPESLLKFFQQKVDMFIKILRIAVDATKRPFVLKFQVTDEESKKYEFISETLKQPIIKIDGSTIEYDAFFSKS